MPDSIIKTKYSQDSQINALEYMQKIVQLPFHILVMSSYDVVNMIEKNLQVEINSFVNIKQFV